MTIITNGNNSEAPTCLRQDINWASRNSFSRKSTTRQYKSNSTNSKPQRRPTRLPHTLRNRYNRKCLSRTLRNSTSAWDISSIAKR